MKRKNVKVPVTYALILGAALCLCSCGTDMGDNPNTFIMENPASDKTQGQEIDPHATDTEPNAEDETPEDSTYSGVNGSAETDITVSAANSTITVTIESMDDVELTTEDGTLYYTITCSYPVVFINGNEAAAEKINADIRSRVDAFDTGVNIQAETAKEDYEYLISNDEYTPPPYSSDLSFTVTRADDHVISFTQNDYIYMGGAHGLPGTTGINYDTATGELIAFGDLSDDPDAFYADTLAYNQELANTEYYSMQMFNTDDITNGVLENTLYADGMWYLSTAGLVFMSPPYALAPYAAGTLKFTVPYSELGRMGLKESYTYTGRQIVELNSYEPYRIDLNGDGNDDAVIFSNEWVDTADGGVNTLTHLTVNDVDYTLTGTEDVTEALTFPWGVKYCIYDLDINDDYVELAAIGVEYGDTELAATSYSRFFRYTKDGSLIYLGQVSGDVTDLSVSFTASDLQRDS